MSLCAQTNDYAVLNINRFFNAPIERVFAAWSNADLLANWFGPPGFTVLEAEVNLTVGDKYLIVLQSPDGLEIKHYGECVEISFPDKLSFTWVLEDQACWGSVSQSANTLLSINFKIVENGTEIELTHENFPNKEAFDGHSFGWTNSLDCLEDLFPAAQFQV